jgi:hypothetical protein
MGDPAGSDAVSEILHKLQLINYFAAGTTAVRHPLQEQIFIYLALAQVLVWDVLNSLRDEYTIFFKHKWRFPVLITKADASSGPPRHQPVRPTVRDEAEDPRQSLVSVLISRRG